MVLLSASVSYTLSPVSFRLLCFVAQNKKIRTLKKDIYKGENTQEHRLRTLVCTAWLKKTFKGGMETDEQHIQ